MHTLLLLLIINKQISGGMQTGHTQQHRFWPSAHLPWRQLALRAVVILLPAPHRHQRPCGTYPLRVPGLVDAPVVQVVKAIMHANLKRLGHTVDVTVVCRLRGVVGFCAGRVLVSIC
jgi:hypothetical protein